MYVLLIRSHNFLNIYYYLLHYCTTYCIMNRISIKKFQYVLYYKLSEKKFTYHLHYYNKYAMNFC